MGRRLWKNIWLHTIFIMAGGLIALFSASHHNVRVSHEVFYDQLIFSFVGILIMYILSRLDYRRFYDAAYVFYILNVIILFLVLVSGRHALGARRWIEIGGLSFQPSEITKICIILTLGRYLSNRRPSLSFGIHSRLQIIWRDLIFPLGITLVLMLLIFKQPDLGTSILIFGIFLIMIFVNGIERKIILTFLAMCILIAPFAWHILKPYQKDRLLVFLNPNIDPLGSGYTIIQSKIAMGSGQLFGKGWLSGTQNQLNFLPERHTDFIFSVVGEEWGFLGAMFLVYCYFVVIYSGLHIAEQLNDKFGSIVAIGIVGILCLQVIINIGMVMGMFPVVGITLPLVSYGRTSFMVFSIMIGILLSLSRRVSY
jgi:rod shape determining protein RodA